MRDPPVEMKPELTKQKTQPITRSIIYAVQETCSSPEGAIRANTLPMMAIASVSPAIAAATTRLLCLSPRARMDSVMPCTIETSTILTI